MALMHVKSMYGQAGEPNMGLVGKKYLPLLLSHEKAQKDARKFFANLDKPPLLFAVLRVIAGNVPEKGLLALGPFMPHMPCATTRRKGMNKLLNYFTSNVVSTSFNISTLDSDEAAAAAMAAEAQCRGEEEEELADEEVARVVGWDGTREDGACGGEQHELDELATAACDASCEGGSYGLSVLNDGPVLMLPLLMMLSCVRKGHISRHVVFRVTADCAVIKNVGIVKGEQHVTACITQAMGNGSPGTELAMHQFRGNMRSARALVNRVGRGPDKEPWLTATTTTSTCAKPPAQTVARSGASRSSIPCCRYAPRCKRMRMATGSGAGPRLTPVREPRHRQVRRRRRRRRWRRRRWQGWRPRTSPTTGSTFSCMS